MNPTRLSANVYVELTAIVHEMSAALTNLSSAAILLQSSGFQNERTVERAQVLIDELNRLRDLHDRQRRILQRQARET